MHRLHDADALQASVCTVHSLSPAPRPRKRAKKIESKPGGGSIACERVQRYCMQSNHLQVSIPRMYLCAVYLSPRLQRAAPTLKGERWRGARKEGLVLSAAMPRDLLRGDRSSRGARPRGWMNEIRTYSSSVRAHHVAAATRYETCDYEWKLRPDRRRDKLFDKRSERRIVVSLAQNYPKRYYVRYVRGTYLPVFTDVTKSHYAIVKKFTGASRLIHSGWAACC